MSPTTETPDQWQPSARQRTCHADRQQAIEALTNAWRAGRLTRDEFQARSRKSLAVTYTDEIDDLTAGIDGFHGRVRLEQAGAGTCEATGTRLEPGCDQQRLGILGRVGITRKERGEPTR